MVHINYDIIKEKVFEGLLITTLIRVLAALM